METKICSLCKEEKQLSDFYFNKTKNRHVARCKECILRVMKEYVPSDRTKFTSPEEFHQHRLALKKQWKQNNREKYLAEKKRYREKHRKQRSDYQKQYMRERREKMNTSVKMVENWNNYLRKRLCRYISDTKSVPMMDFFLQCSKEDFKLYIESLFQEGMTWENYGVGKIEDKKWQIDHYIPISFFNLENPKEALICWNYQNLRPCWVKDNFSKHTAIPEDYQEVIDKITQSLHF